MDVLIAREGSIGAEDPMDFLEPVSYLGDGPRCVSVRLGALVSGSACSASVPAGRVDASYLNKARAQEVLEFLRRCRDQDGQRVFKGMGWLLRVPVVAGYDNLSEGLRFIRQAIEELSKSKHVTISRPHSARWAVEKWEITLM